MLLGLGKLLFLLAVHGHIFIQLGQVRGDVFLGFGKRLVGLRQLCFQCLCFVFLLLSLLFRLLQCILEPLNRFLCF